MSESIRGQRLLGKLERQARRAAVISVGVLVLASMLSIVYVERQLRSAVSQADAEWRAQSTLREKIWSELLRPCNENGEQGILTRDGCDTWAVAQARQRWSADISDDVRSLRATEQLSAFVAISQIPAPLRWCATWLAGVVPSMTSQSGE